MSNETDLDWLARNVHVWREGANYVCVNHTDGGYVFHEHNRNCAIWFTKDQWLSRRAELQSVIEQFKPSIEEANRLAQEFKPFTSIEDNQGQEMKQDNKWFERGELPPVGCECEILGAFGHHQEWFPCKIIAEHSGSVFAANERAWINVKHGERKFRPLRTERDELIEIISSSLLVTTEQVADAIIAAGFKLEAK